MTEKTAGSSKPSPSAKADDIDFEAALAELETLVAAMEEGSMTLEESLTAFERGIKLSRRCQSALKNAELRVQTLMKDGELAPFDASNSEG